MKSAFKNSKSFEDRRHDSAQIKREHPDKTAIIVERASNEKNLPILDKSKFLVPAHVTMHEFTRVLRRRLELSPGQALFLMTQKGMPAGTQSLAELFEKVSFEFYDLPNDRLRDSLKKKSFLWSHTDNKSELKFRLLSQNDILKIV